jgi:hypothetical protein
MSDPVHLFYVAAPIAMAVCGLIAWLIDDWWKSRKKVRQ